MLLFSGILINLSVRHHPVRVPLWLTTQQLVAANSTVSNLNQEPDSTDSTDSTSSSATASNASDQKAQLGPVPKRPYRKLDVRNLFAKEYRLQSVKKMILSVDPSKMQPDESLRVISKLSKMVRGVETKTTDLKVEEKYPEVSYQPSKEQVFEKKLGYFFDMNEIHKITKGNYMTIESVVQILSKLAFHKSRAVPVLQFLSNQIVENNWTINIKQASDVLYNMSYLNFYDEALIEKIASILISEIPKTKKKHTAVIGSILKSIGMLRYRNENLTFQLTEWILENSKSARPQEICSFLMMLAVVGHSPLVDAEKFKHFTESLTEAEMFGAEDWLNVVWALVVLNQANKSQVLSVLDTTFVERLSYENEITESKKRKLLNILAVAKLIFKHDTDQFFKDNPWVLDVTLERTKEKQEFGKEVIKSLHILIPSSKCLKTNVNTGMGFIIDAEFYVNKNCSPILINQIESKKDEALRLAIVPESYYDFCRGDEQEIKSVPFQCDLLRKSGYHVILVPYTEFNLEQTIVERAKYLKDNIKKTVEKCSL